MLERDMTQEEFDEAMNAAAKRGALIGLLGLVTFGIGPCIYWMLRARKERM